MSEPPLILYTEKGYLKIVEQVNTDLLLYGQMMSSARPAQLDAEAEYEAALVERDLEEQRKREERRVKRAAAKREKEEQAE